MGSTLYERAGRLDIVVRGERLLLTAAHSKRSAAGRRLLLLHGNPGGVAQAMAWSAHPRVERITLLGTRIASAVTFVHGELDALVPSRHARNLHELRVAAGLPSTFVLVPNAGHMLPLTHPELVAKHARGDSAAI